MRWRNTETPTFAGSAGSGGAPAKAETFELLDRDGNVVATFAKSVAGAISLQIAGSVDVSTLETDTLTENAVDVLTTASGLRVAHAKYSFAVNGGAVSTIAPADSDTIPDNAILVGATINSTTAVTSDGSATVGVGTSAGSSTTSILAATAKASLSIDAVLNGVPVFATPVKMTAAGTITFTVGTADLTAGVIEVWVYYVVAAA